MKHILQGLKQITLVFIFFMATLAIKAQISEGFEGSFPPTGWAVFPGTSGSSDTEWEQQDDFESTYNNYGFAHTGNFATISSFDYEDETEGWLVTPQFTPTADEHTLYFHQRQAFVDEYNSEFSIRISTTSQTTHADFTVLETQTEADVPFVYGPHTVDLSAYIGTPIYIAFVHTQDDDDEWYIDNVLTAPIEVPGPSINPSPADGATGIALTNSQSSHISFSWEAPTTGGAVEQYNFAISHDANALRILGHPDDFTANPSTFHFNTTYYWKAAALNMGGENSVVWSFTTALQPTFSAPYTIDFENAGSVPDGCDQLVTNEKWWKYSDNIAVGHIGNDDDTQGTVTDSGNYFAYIDDSQSPNALNTTFATPFIDLSTLAEPAFSFFMISHDEGGGNVDFSVEAGNDTNGYSEVFTSNTNTAGWEKKIIGLGAVDCTIPVQLRFIINENNSTAKDDFAIDDIVFNTLDALSTPDNGTIEGLSYFPNPTTDRLTIKAIKNIESVEIHNLLGQCVLKTTPSAAEISIDISNLAKGGYIVKVATKHLFETFKITKN